MAHWTILSNFGRSGVLVGAAGIGGLAIGTCVWGEEWDGVGSCCRCVLGLSCVVVFVLVCQTIARYPYRARHGMVACTPLATWSRSLFGRRRGAVQSVTHTLSPPPLLSHRSAPVCASHGAPHRLSRACERSRWARSASRRRRSEPSCPRGRLDPPFVPAMVSGGADRCVSAPEAVCSPVSLSACHGAGGGAPGRCVSPKPVLSPPSR